LRVEEFSHDLKNKNIHTNEKNAALKSIGKVVAHDNYKKKGESAKRMNKYEKTDEVKEREV
jgi:hypothetical protein